MDADFNITTLGGLLVGLAPFAYKVIQEYFKTRKTKADIQSVEIDNELKLSTKFQEIISKQDRDYAKLEEKVMVLCREMDDMRGKFMRLSIAITCAYKCQHVREVEECPVIQEQNKTKNI